jgi:hypothetical protein
VLRCGYYRGDVLPEIGGAVEESSVEMPVGEEFLKKDNCR